MPLSSPYVRGTFSEKNPDFSQDVIHLYDQGFHHIAMEPVVSDPAASWALSLDQVAYLKEQYDNLVEFALASREKGEPLHFHHFELDVERGPCLGRG